MGGRTVEIALVGKVTEGLSSTNMGGMCIVYYLSQVKSEDTMSEII
jgi:hypothetical protein